MIYFVGAGSGAPDLITVRGMRLLQKADVIIYAGSLVNPQLLDYAKEPRMSRPDCRLLSGSASQSRRCLRPQPSPAF